MIVSGGMHVSMSYYVHRLYKGDMSCLRTSSSFSSFFLVLSLVSIASEFQGLCSLCVDGPRWYSKKRLDYFRWRSGLENQLSK